MKITDLFGKQKKCKNCEQYFTPMSGRPDLILYCSPKCKKEHEKNTKRYELKCDNCGKVFYRNSKNKKGKHCFCCNACVGEYNSKRGSIIKKCEICGKEFKTRNSTNKRFCSIDCQIEWQRKFPRTGENHPSYKHDISIKERTLICQCCGKEYRVAPHLINVSKYCSRKCKHSGMINEARTKKTWQERTNTIPQKIVNDILNKNNIEFQNEYDCGLYFTVDNYCVDTGLMIEVMGTYWHADIREYQDLYEVQKRDVIQDKRKKTYILNNFNVHILYLWEKDLKENVKLCEELVKEYIKNNGVLKDYNSFNYSLIDNKLSLNHKIILGYMDLENDYKNLNHYNKTLND